MAKETNIARISTIALFLIFIGIVAVETTIDLSKEDTSEEIFHRDYDIIAKSQELRVALIEKASEYCIFNAQPRGFQLETFEDFAYSHDLELEIIKAQNELDAEKLLNDGVCDIIVKYTSSPDSSCMTNPLQTTSLIVITNSKLPIDTVFSTTEQTACKMIWPLEVIDFDSLSSEDIARKVVSGEIRSAICDSILATTYQKAYPKLIIDSSFCIQQKVVWKTHEDAIVLRDTLNEWLAREIQSDEYKLRQKIYNSYIKINVASQYYSGNGNRISVYDEEIRHNAKAIGWDWRFIASLIYEESRFNPYIGNPSGAYGLMQLMPGTYRKFASDSTAISTPNGQIKAGIRYISSLKKKVPETITDTAVIIRFVLMGYNAGLGHAEDAYKLAEKYSDNPNTWENLSKYMSHLHDRKYYSDKTVKCGQYKGIRTVIFTNNIINRYKHYRNLIE